MLQETGYFSPNKNAAGDGFTLIELSIVLVIIALIVGGILIGQSMIRQSQVMSVFVDEQKYVTAAKSFRDKYNALPGDMTNATSYWGTDPNGCPNLGPWTSTPQTTTCNGDGNGVITAAAGTWTQAAAVSNFENFRAWQQLADAGFILGGYSGTPGTTVYMENDPGSNVPASRVPNAGFEWYVFSATSSVAPAYFYTPPYYKQYLLFGSNYVTVSGKVDLYAPVLTAAEAQSIDIKIDDGYPSTGGVLGSTAGPGAGQFWNCSQGTSPPVYETTRLFPQYYAGGDCSMLFQVNW